MSPLRIRGLADCVLVAEQSDYVEQSDFVEIVLCGNGIQPLDTHEVCSGIRVFAALPVARSVADDVYRQLFAFGRGQFELVGRLHRFQHPPHPDVAGLGDVDPDPVAGGQQLQRLAVPAATAAADVAVAPGVVPGAAAAVGDVELPVRSEEHTSELQSLM